LKEYKSTYNRNTCTPMLISAWFTIAKVWNQPRCSSTNEWIKKYISKEIWNYIHIISYIFECISHWSTIQT
jgi:hypothetical protein